MHRLFNPTMLQRTQSIVSNWNKILIKTTVFIHAQTMLKRTSLSIKRKSDIITTNRLHAGTDCRKIL